MFKRRVGRPPQYVGQTWQELEGCRIAAFEAHLHRGEYYVFFVDPVTDEKVPVLKLVKKSGQVTYTDPMRLHEAIAKNHPDASLKVFHGDYIISVCKTSDYAGQYRGLSAAARTMVDRRLGLDLEDHGPQKGFERYTLSEIKHNGKPIPTDPTLSKVIEAYVAAGIGEQAAAKGVAGINDDISPQNAALDVARCLISGKTTTNGRLDSAAIFALFGGMQGT